MTRRRILTWLLYLAGLVVALAVAAAWFVGGQLVAPANRIVGSPPDDLPTQAVTIPSASGTTLAAWHIPAPGARATIILLHSIRSDRRSMLPRARLLHDRGYSTLLIDLQAHGESPGDAITLGHLERHDVIAAVDFVRTTTPDHRVGIIGRSLGGAATVFADPEVDVVVLESVFSSVADAVHNRVSMRLGPLHHVIAPMLLIQLKPRLGVAADALRPLDEVVSLSCPVLIVSGDQDRRATIDQARALFAAAPDPKALVVFPGAAHVDLLDHDPARYETDVVGFLHRHLTPDVSD